MDMTFCLSALEKALAQDIPEIFNSDELWIIRLRQQFISNSLNRGEDI
jgi:hypothetical protein